jgi:hypothetical protein
MADDEKPTFTLLDLRGITAEKVIGMVRETHRPHIDARGNRGS